MITSYLNKTPPFVYSTNKAVFTFNCFGGNLKIILAFSHVIHFNAHILFPFFNILHDLQWNSFAWCLQSTAEWLCALQIVSQQYVTAKTILVYLDESGRTSKIILNYTGVARFPNWEVMMKLNVGEINSWNNSVIYEQ